MKISEEIPQTLAIENYSFSYLSNSVLLYMDFLPNCVLEFLQSIN